MAKITAPAAFPAKRRDFLQLAAAVAGGAWVSGAALAQTPARIPIADMHSHLGVLGMFKPPNTDAAADMRANDALLVAWKVVADAPWIMSSSTGISQRSVPNPAELWRYFERTVLAMQAYARQSKLPLVRTAADVDTALAGSASVVLSSEGADFLAGDLGNLKKAFDMGLRHLQLLHYIRSPLGDFSTESPVHNGLTDLGRDVIKGCEAQGILVDLAHCSSMALDQALEVTTKPMVWSHGWVDGKGGSPTDPYGFLKRRLSVEQAKKIAARGGVIGLWALGLNQRAWRPPGLCQRAGQAGQPAGR
jgi:membrane dipeptidase